MESRKGSENVDGGESRPANRPGQTKIRNARTPYQVPALGELPDRLDAVLRVICLVFILNVRRMP